MSIKLPEIIDTWNLLDKYNLEDDVDWYHEGKYIIVTDSGLDKFPNTPSFNDYLKRVMNGGHFKTGSRNMTLASTDIEGESEIVFTPASLLDLISKVDELSQYEVGLTTTMDDQLQLQIGDSLYDITSDSNIEDIVTDENTVDQISDVNEETYDNLLEDESISNEPIEGGLIKEAIKTLAIGGLVRLGKQYLSGDKA